MKKILITTTALASLFAGAAFAEVQTNVGGSLVFLSASVSQKSAYKTKMLNSSNQKNRGFYTKSQVFVAANSKADNGVNYGANIVLNPVANASTGFTNGKSDRTYFFVESEAGRVELGSNYSVTRLMRVGADTIAHGTGGAVSGDWNNYVNFPFQANPEENSPALAYITSGDNLIARTEGAESSRKISWMSPRYSGFQFGLSYTPDQSNDGTGKGVSATNPNNFYKNVFGFAANYSQAYDNMNVALSLAYDTAKFKDSTSRKLSSYQFGAAVGAGDFTVAASYGSDGKSGYLKNIPNNSYKYWTAGVAYENGPFGGSLTYLSSKQASAVDQTLETKGKANKVSAYSLSVDYKAAPGVLPFAEVTYFNAKEGFTGPNVTPGRNKGTVVLLGTGISF